MSSQGSPWIGDQSGYSVDTSLGTQIERYQLVQVSPDTEADSFAVGLCATDAGNLAIGNAFRAWPYVPQVFAPANRPSTDITTYDAAKKLHMTIRQKGFSWFKVEIEAGGSNILVEQGEMLIPSTGVAGGVMPASPLTGTYNSSILDENIIARAYSRIIIPPSGASFPQPGPGGLGLGTGVATLTSITNAVTYGYVFGRFESKGRSM